MRIAPTLLAELLLCSCSIVVLLSLILTACAQSRNEGEVKVSVPTHTPGPIEPARTAMTPAPPIAMTPLATRPPVVSEINVVTPIVPTRLPLVEPSPEITHYALTATLDYERQHLSVLQTVTYVNRSPHALSELLFVVEPNRQPGVFHLHELHWIDGRPITGYLLNGARLHLPLPVPLAPTSAVGLSLTYELYLPEEPGGPFGYTSRQSNLGDWYPFVPPYQAGRGWLAHEAAAVGEHLVYDVANYEVNIRLLDFETELVIAASALAERDGDWRRYRLEASRSFAWSVSPEYQVLEEMVDSVLVTSYVFPQHVVAGRAVLETTTQALRLYSELFGAYPHKSLAVVEADFRDGMEYDGLYFLGTGLYAAYTGDPRVYLIALAAHETAHQWWYGLVGNDHALEPWLDEALATYSELLFYETFYPELIGWWWRSRIFWFQPAGYVDSTIYEHEDFRSYVNAVYLRGAMFMADLRRLIGDEAFFAFWRDYAAQGRRRQMRAEDFFATLAAYSSKDISVLKEAYFSQMTDH